MNDSTRLDSINIIRETSSAILLLTAEGEEVWLPLSQVDEIHKHPQPDESWIIAKTWILRSKGLI